jgi:hypothetical protein
MSRPSSNTSRAPAYAICSSIRPSATRTPRRPTSFGRTRRFSRYRGMSTRCARGWRRRF